MVTLQLMSHENSKYHKDSFSAGKHFFITYHAPQLEIINQVNSQRLAQVQENRLIEDRLNGLALMHIHREISIDIDQVIDRFEKNKSQKLDFVL